MGEPHPRAPTLDGPQLELLLELGRDLMEAGELPPILRRVVETACALTGARYGALGVLDDDRRELAEFITTGLDEEAARAIGELPRGRGVLGLLIDTPEALRLADVGEHPRSYGFPPGHPPMRTFLGVPVLVRGEAWGNFYLADKAGGAEFTEADEAAVGVLAAWAGAAIDMASAYRREHERREELERAVAALEATTAIARALGGETDLGVILELIAKRGRDLVGARGLIVLLRERDELEVRAQAGELPALRGRRIRVEGSVSGLALARGRGERLSDPGSRVRFVMADVVEAETALFVPVIFRGRRLGALNAFDKLGGGEFTDDDERLLEAFAASAATAVATAQEVATRELRRAIEAAEGERGRWARELHDETLQDLAAVRLGLAAVRASPEVGPAARDQLAAALDQLELSITGLRQLIADLRPAALDELGVAPALDALATRLATLGRLDVELDVRLAAAPDGAGARLPAPVEETAYRLVQEALNNAIKHSGAERARVTLLEDEHVVTVTVADDGRGFDPDDHHDGFGLVGMRERVALVGGTLEVRSAPGGGTTVRAVLPARPTAAAPARAAP